MKIDQRKKEQISSIFFLLFSVFICYFSYRLSMGSINNPGVGFFPFYMGIILGLLSIRNFIKALLQRNIIVETKNTSNDKINWKNIIVTVVVLFAYPLLLNILGFPVSVFFFTAFFLRFINPPQKWPVVFGVGGGVAIAFYFIFQYWLKIEFPSGLFGL